MRNGTPYKVTGDHVDRLYSIMGRMATNVAVLTRLTNCCISCCRPAVPVAAQVYRALSVGFLLVCDVL